MQKIYFGHAMSFFKKGMALSFLIFLGLIARAQSLTADGYEPNNTKETATPLTATFTGNTSTIDISSVSCHVAGDVDIYKIELPAGGSYIFSADLYDRGNQQNSNYTLYAKMSYSMDNAVNWSSAMDNRQLPRVAVPAGTLYLKIEPFWSENVGTYAAKIDLSRATTAGCTYALTGPTNRQVTADAGANQQIEITTGTTCFWAAASNVNWIRLTTQSQSGTGSGNVIYSYDANTTPSARTGTITVAGQAYTVTQAALSPDGYEENNSVADAKLLPLPTPPFTQNANTTINISSANCHISSDVDYYKIELPAGASYIFSAELYDRGNQWNNSHYTLLAKISCSTDHGVTWNSPTRELSRTAAPAGTLYLKIEPYFSGDIGTYSAKIDLRMATTAGCTYTLPTPASRQVTADAGDNQQIALTATGGTACFWAAASNVNWLWLTAGIGTGPGNVVYSYTENRTLSSRTGIITVAGHDYTVTQTPHPLLPDGYEPNNTVAEAKLLPIPPFTQNVSTLNISPASCHVVGDVDIYKIELPAGGSYIFSAALYDKNNRLNNSAYTLDAKMSYSTDNGTTWSATIDSRLPRTVVPGGTLYLKIESNSSGDIGTYSAKIDLSIAATAGCTYTLTGPTSRQVTAEAATNQQIVLEVAATTIGATCSWTAFTNADWITLTAESGTGPGNVIYSYTANTTPSARTGTITVAGQAYTVTQAAPQPDGYEPNNTVAEAKLLPIPPFTQNVSTINISPASCHVADDVDYYKIEVPTGSSYTFSAELYDTDSNSSRYTLDVKASYSTDGSTWTTPGDRLPRAVAPAGTFYLKIEPYSSSQSGTYAAKIDLRMATTAGCTYTLTGPPSRQVTADPAIDQQIAVVAITTTGTTCYWTATSNVNWITITAGQSGTGSGNVVYSYTTNPTPSSRTGIITVAGQAYTVTQAPFQPDGYEPNNAKETATPLTATFTGNTSTIDISSVSCHRVDDVDIYKIELPVGSSYTFSADLYDANNQRNNSAYTLDAKMSYSTDGVNWISPDPRRLPRMTVPAGTLYLKIESYLSGNNVGTYAAKIDLSIAATAGCTYVLTEPTILVVTAEAATNQQIAITTTATATGATCYWTATSNVDWITITTESGTGSGSVSYSYTGNTTSTTRTGTITIAGQRYIVTQSPIQADSYEPNNNKETATPLTATFTGNTSTIDISLVNCHVASDVDFYKIELPAGGSYIFSAELYDRYNPRNNSNYMLYAKISYSTNGIAWSSPAPSRLPRMTVQGGTLYLKIEPYSSGNVGAYSAKIDLSRATTVGCTYTLTGPTSRQVTAEAATDQQIAITTTATTTGATCHWTATSNVDWITITAGRSGTGSGRVIYSYTGNTTSSARTGIITVADKTYTVTQAVTQPDGYEPNNTVAEAKLLPIPPFTQNVSTINISPANYHVADDVDYYKIELPDGASYVFSAELYDRYNQRNNSNYTLNATIFYSTDGGLTWSSPGYNELLSTPASGGTLYLKIEPGSNGDVGTYAAKIDLSIAATAGCTYTLSATSKAASAEWTSDQQVEVTTEETCSWAAASNVDWIRLIDGQSGTGAGSVRYSYHANTTESSRTGIIMIAGQVYTVTQAPRLPDEYEPNNTAAEAKLLSIPPFTQNTSAIHISSASCHVADDVDYYKIELPLGASYIFSAELYDSYSQQMSRNYTLYAKMSYSTDNGVTWSKKIEKKLPRMTVQGGTFYLKIEPSYSGNVGTYAAKIDLHEFTTTGCAYTLSATSKDASADAGANQQVAVATEAACSWAAVSNADWIRLTAGQSGTGAGRVSYSYTENTSLSPRTGTITIAGQPYTVTQAPHPLLPDDYEANNSKETAAPLIVAFTGNTSAINISSASCHVAGDVDYYKIELPAGYSYLFSAELHDRNNRGWNDSYTLDAKASYSTDGVAWSDPADRTLPIVTVPGGGTLYLKIEPNLSGAVGTYSATIGLSKVTTAGCNYTLPVPSRSVTAEAAANQQVAVETGATCFWTAVSNVYWIRLTAGQSGTGAGSVSYSYDENASSSSRTGIITVAGQDYTVTQAPLSPDDYEANNTKSRATPLTATFTGNTSAIDISSVNCHVESDVDVYKINFAADYAYTVSAVLYDVYNPNNNSKYGLNAKMSYSINNNNNDEWIPVNGDRLSSMIAPPGGTLYLKIEPTLSYYGAANVVGTYAAKIDITSNCNCSLPVLYRSVLSAAGAGEVAVARTAPACTDSWTAVSNATWITVTSGASATGSGNVGYSYTQNTSLFSRRGTITIGGQAYTVTQAGRPDGYEPNNTVAQAQANSLTPVFTQNESATFISSANFHKATDVDIYKINLGADFYTVSVLLGDVQGVGVPKISYSTDGLEWTDYYQWQNPTVSGSALYIKIAPFSQAMYAVSYAAKINIKVLTTSACTYSLSAASNDATSQAGADQINVTTSGSACAWTAVSTGNDWITITSGQSGTGSGSVGYYYKENASLFERTGTITIGGQTYTLTQAPPPRHSPDRYEPNNTASQATLFTPTFTGNAGVVDISSVNCHAMSDADYYKIELGTGAAPYTINGRLYKQVADAKNNRFYGKILYSTDGIAWTEPLRERHEETPFQLTSQGGTLYLKVEPPQNEDYLGHYAVKVDIVRGCTYSLDAASKEVQATEGSYQVEVTASDSSPCPYRAVSNANWIGIISGNYATGSGRVTYSCNENTTAFSRTGILLIAGQTYTVTQSAAQPLLPDKYEPNNTVGQASLLTPTVAQNTTSVSISSVNCHDAEDVDFYKINLETDHAYISGNFYCRYNDRNRNYRLEAKIYYSTDAGLSNWTEWGNAGRRGLLPNLLVQGRTLYLKIEQNRDPYHNRYEKTEGAYAVELDITGGCAYSLWADEKQLTSAAGSDQISVIATSSNSSSCPWTATSNAPWITIASGQQTGSGNVSYSYTENNTTSSRTATITVARRTYTVTQSPRSLSPDGYEPNNTVERATLLTATFTQNASSLTISSVNCHHVGDIDVYKIELPAGNSYQVSGALYDLNNPNGNSRYTLDAKISCSADGIAWSEPQDSQLPNLTMSGGTLYLRMEPYVDGYFHPYSSSPSYAFEERVGSYAAKIDILKTTADCTYSLGAARETLTATDVGSHQVNVEAGSLCAWAATSHAPWITLASNQVTTGPGSVSYSCRENASSYPRAGTITIAGQTYTVVQAGGSLSADRYEPNNTVATASPLSPVFTQNASALTVLSVNCHEAGDVDIYKIELASGYSYVFNAFLYDAFTQNNSNNHTLYASLAYSTDGLAWSEKNIEFTGISARAGTLYLKVQPYLAGLVGTYEARVEIKSACAYSLAASSVEVVGNSSTETVEVTAGASCPWRAVSDADWITVNPAQGTGTGTARVSYTVARNTGAERTGTITIAGQTLTVRQAVALPCSYTLPSTPIAALSVAGAGEVSVTATATDCPWTATPNVSWITITSGQTLVGTKNLNFSYEANPSNASREGTITIAGGTVTVTQAGAVCSYTLFPTSMTVFSAAGTGKVSVTASATDCPWTATSNVPWITIPAGQTLAGTKDLDFSYEANSTNAPREGTITIAGQTFTVKQSSLSLSSPPATGFETASPVKIFPNPAKDFVTIEVSSSNQEWVSLKITNMFGQALYERTNPEHKMQIPLTGFSSGLYFVVLQGKEKTAVQKLIIE